METFMCFPASRTSQSNSHAGVMLRWIRSMSDIAIRSLLRALEPDRSFEKLDLGFQSRIAVAAPIACIMHGILQCICDEI